MVQRIVLDKNVINNMNLTSLYKYVEWSTENFPYFDKPCGKEHYKLLAYFSLVIKSKKIVDIGTYHGMSAVALSYDSSKTIESYDILSSLPGHGQLCAHDKENVSCRICDPLQNIQGIIKNCDFILLDIDHTGVTEKKIMEALREAGYKGLLMLDDIGLSEEMKAFWDEIPETKIDISAYGHWSQTGLVIFDPTRFEVFLE